MIDILMKIFIVALLVIILLLVTLSLTVTFLPDFLENLDNCIEAIRKRKKPKAPEAAAVKIITREANVQTLKASHYVNNPFIDKMTPEEIDRNVVTCLSEKLAESIVPFMEVRYEKDRHGIGTMFTAEIKVVDTGSGLGQQKEEESNG